MRAALLALALLLVPVLSGCTSPAPDLAPAAVVKPAAATTMVFNGKGEPVTLPPPAAAAASAIAFAIHPLGHDGAEPTMGIDAKNNVFVISGTAVMRSSDQGATWKDVSPLVNDPRSLDPLLHVDVDTGRVFVDHLYGACSYLAFSDSQGASWLYNLAACGLPANDHQTIATGKPIGVSTIGYKNVVYFGYNGVAASFVARSLDGGITFAGATIAVDPAHCGGLNGHLVTDKDGILYMPSAGCDQPVVAVSRDSGLTWEQHTIDTGGVGRSTPGDDPSIAVDSDGNAFLVFPGKDALMYGSTSTDKGKTWSPIYKVSPPALTSTVMATSVAGDAGRVAFAYYGTNASTKDWKSPNSNDADKDARWHLFVTYSEDAILGANATWVTTQVTPDENPVKIGVLFNGGGGNPDRNLLDFFDMARDADGRVIVAYTDGCAHKCTDQASSRNRATVAATMVEGPSLLTGRA